MTFHDPGSSVAWNWIGLLEITLGLIQLFLRKYHKQEKQLTILHLSNNFIVIYKEPDILINSNDPTVSSSLHLSLSKQFPSLVIPSLRHNFYFVHRLDYVTSGVICVGLNKKASSAAASAFENRIASKYYLALLRGHVSAELIEIDIPIGELQSEIHGSHQMTVINDADVCVNPRPSVTRLLLLERGIFDGYPATKVILKPITGRRHQLRVHCAYLGHTIVGDYTYSRRKDVTPNRTYLHALRLTLPNSVEPLDIQTSDPFEFVAGWVPVEKCNPLNETSFNRLQTTSTIISNIIKVK